MKELYDSFSYLQSELTNYIANLQYATSIKEKMESEMRIAHDIQMGMLRKEFPPFPDRKEIDIYAILKPAKEVGGDLYDFFLDGDNLYFVIGDVSGKGVPASIMMAVSLGLLRSTTMRMQSIAAAMNSLNASIAENNVSNMFITLWMGVFDLKSGLLRFCNAGHNPPILITSESKCEWLQVIPNLPAGVLKEFSYQEQSITLPASSALVLYSDGVTEAENANKEFYSEKKLMNVVQQNLTSTPIEMIDTLLDDLHLHVKDNEPSDDITMMMFKYYGKNGMNRDARDHSSTLVICNHIDELSKIVPFVDQLSLPPELVMGINLALEEAVTNVICYAYGKEKGEEKKIEITASVCENKLQFSITDYGEEFDPTQVDNPDTTLSAQNRPIGGLGIFLIRQLMDEVEYKRENNKNILILSKKIIT
jgi:sigma-B regulation protein RsbU (phosphoserine phosphatase)